jgi:nucleoside-diphosphate-sugar epimerase
LNVAVTGATGYVGRFIVGRLIAGGAAVRAWRRPSSDLRGLPGEIEWVEGDLSAPESSAPLLAGTDALVHAALHHLPGRYRGGEGDDAARFLKTNVDGSIALLEAAHREGVGRAVVLSSRAVFGRDVAGSIGDEHPVSPDTHYGAAKAALEEFVRACGTTEWPITALRPTGVYGVVDPVELSKWFSLVNDVLDGNAIPTRSGTEVHGEDVAAAVVLLLHAPAESVAGRVFNCSDLVVSNRELVALVREAAETPGPLPAEETTQLGVMRTEALEALGLSFGGLPLLKRTINELVSAVRKTRRRAALIPG